MDRHDIDKTWWWVWDRDRTKTLPSSSVSLSINNSCPACPAHTPLLTLLYPPPPPSLLTTARTRLPSSSPLSLHLPPFFICPFCLLPVPNIYFLVLMPLAWLANLSAAGLKCSSPFPFYPFTHTCPSPWVCWVVVWQFGWAGDWQHERGE